LILILKSYGLRVKNHFEAWNFVLKANELKLSFNKREYKVELKGKIALVTGSARGIGKAIALRFAREGARVALNDINNESLKEAAREIQKVGRENAVYKKVGDKIFIL